MTHFDRNAVAADLEILRGVFTQFYSGVYEDDWPRNTGSREKDWTLLQATAHLASIAVVFNAMPLAARRRTIGEVDGVSEREELRDWNTREIARLTTEKTPGELVATLDKELARAASLASKLNDETLARVVPFPIYNRPVPVANFIDWQLSHAGVVHGAQITRALDQAPLWERVSADMRRRHVDRFLRHLSWAYWNTRAPHVDATLQFTVAGDEGGTWTLFARPDGGDIQRGTVAAPDFRYWFAEPGVLFSLFTVNESFETALKRGEFRYEGDDTRALPLLAYFAASPPGHALP